MDLAVYAPQLHPRGSPPTFDEFVGTAGYHTPMWDSPDSSTCSYVSALKSNLLCPREFRTGSLPYLKKWNNHCQKRNRESHPVHTGKGSISCQSLKSLKFSLCASPFGHSMFIPFRIRARLRVGKAARPPTVLYRRSFRPTFPRPPTCDRF